MLIWNKLPDVLPHGYHKDDLVKDTRTASYEGDGKWAFSVSGKVREEGPVTEEIMETKDYWVDRESYQVTSFDLYVTADYYERTDALDISVEKQNEEATTETSDMPILEQKIKVKWMTVKGTAHHGYLEGSVENVGRIPVEGLEIEFTIFDEDDNTITIEKCTITPFTLLPGESGKFKRDFLVTGKHLHSYTYRFILEDDKVFEYLEGTDQEQPVFVYEMMLNRFN